MDFSEIDSIINMLDAKHMSNGIYEKRHAERRKADIQVRFLKLDDSGDYIDDTDRNSDESRLIDISTTGTTLLTQAEFFAGDTFQCETLENKTHFRAELKVIHKTEVDQNNRYGCQFIKIHQSSLRAEEENA